MIAFLIGAAVASASVSAFGIEIGQPLALKECAPNESYLEYKSSLSQKKANRRFDKPYLVYAMPETAPCFQRYDNQFEVTPLAKELMTIRFPLSEKLEIAPLWEIQAFVINGSVELITSPTADFRFQNTVLETIERKFGKPAKLEAVPLQNGFGARFEGLRAVWHPSSTVTATYESYVSAKEGDLTIGTPAGIAAYEARNGPPAATLKL